jgi:hypothetical protein
MQPQGTAATDTDYFTALTARINAINGCAELQAVVNEVMASVQAEKNAIEAQLEALAPILALLSPPSIDTIVSWAENLITAVLTPMYRPATTYATQLVQLATAVAGLATAIENAAARLESCTISVPPLT